MDRGKQAASEAVKRLGGEGSGRVVQRTQEAERIKKEGHWEIWKRGRPC